MYVVLLIIVSSINDASTMSTWHVELFLSQSLQTHTALAFNYDAIEMIGFFIITMMR